MRTQNWHFSNSFSSWEREGRIFNLITIHRLQLTSRKQPLLLRTHLFEMPADRTGESIRKICVGLIQSNKEAVADIPDRASEQAHYFHLLLTF